MDSERAADALRKMMRAFQSELSFGDYMDAVGTVSFAALAQTADNFRTGSVPKQSMKRAPFPAEFAQEARRVDENIKTRARAQSLPAPEPTRTKGSSPYEVGLAKMERDFEGYKLAKKNIALHVFNERARAGEYPPGTRWQAGRVYVPDSVRTQATESA